jgi:hypothetical protein
VLNGKRVEKKNKLLKNGRPMIDFESLKELFEFLKFANAPKKH